ncbi:M48 family metalloprotease [Dactylosporangium sp. NPDC048998]|uniref:M48 family metalloprotease n=1 Tax=Dactylosporangium sp. NPDC048998 TaxID=3363976 RepID=UPI003713FCDF
MTGDFGWGPLDRWAHRSARRHTVGAYEAQLQGRPGGTAGSAVLVVSSLMLYLMILVMLAAGLWVGSLSFPGFGLVPAVVLVGTALELRPRFDRLPKFATEVPAAAAPELYRLVGQVAAELGAPAPAISVEDDVFNIGVLAVGLRRRPALVVGLPMWNALSAQQRVAVLGHELGHFVNGDPRRGLLVQPALTTLTRLTRMLAHEPVPLGQSGTVGGPGLLGWLVGLLFSLIKAILRGLLFVPRVVLAVLALRDGQRAEYRADQVAAAVAGRAAMVELLDVLTLSDSVIMLVKREARAGKPVTGWPETIAKLVVEARPTIEGRRDAELDRVSLFDSHPPSGLRARVIEARSGESAAVVANAARNDRIDAELAAHNARSARTLKSM